MLILFCASLRTNWSHAVVIKTLHWSSGSWNVQQMWGAVYKLLFHPTQGRDFRHRAQKRSFLRWPCLLWQVMKQSQYQLVCFITSLYPSHELYQSLSPKLDCYYNATVQYSSHHFPVNTTCVSGQDHTTSLEHSYQMNRVCCVYLSVSYFFVD